MVETKLLIQLQTQADMYGRFAVIEDEARDVNTRPATWASHGQTRSSINVTNVTTAAQATSNPSLQSGDFLVLSLSSI